MDPSALGRYLRESRESKEITLEDAVRALRIRRDILESFEQGDFAVMDSAVRVRGMLRNYAHFLGLEEERVLQYYESALNSKRRRRFGRREAIHAEPIAPRKLTDTQPTLPKIIPPQNQQSSRVANALKNIAMFLVSVAALAVIIFVIVDTLQLGQSEDPVALVPTIPAGEITITATNTPTITPRATVLTDTPSASTFNIEGVQVLVEINQRSWVRISADDVEQYIGFLEPGYSATYQGNNNIAITAANAAALDITYNGVEQESFGVRGQQVELIFTLSGIEITQGEGNLLPTETATSNVTATVQIETPTATEEQVNDASANVASAQAVNTPVSSGLPTPTPLFPVTGAEPQVESIADSSTLPTESQGDTNADPTTIVNTNVPQATLEPTSADTATPSAILPLRETPSNPTATKTA